MIPFSELELYLRRCRKVGYIQELGMEVPYFEIGRARAFVFCPAIFSPFSPEAHLSNFRIGSGKKQNWGPSSQAMPPSGISCGSLSRLRNVRVLDFSGVKIAFTSIFD